MTHEGLSPIEAQRVFVNWIIGSKEISFEQFWSYARRRDVFFGPGVDIMDVLIANIDMGRVRIDMDRERIIGINST